MPIPFYRPSPAPPAVFKDHQLPYHRANLLSRLFFHWITPILKVGYSRPLEADDLWQLTPELECQGVADRLERRFYEHVSDLCRPLKYRVGHKDSEVTSEKSSRNEKSKDNEKSSQSDSSKSLQTLFGDTKALLPKRRAGCLGQSRNTAKVTDEDELGQKDAPVRDLTLARAIYNTVKRQWWISTALLATGYGLQLASPLVSEQLIDRVTAAAQSTGNDDQDAHLRSGIGLAIGLFAMLFTSSICLAHAEQMGFVIGFTMRAACIDMISRKSMRLSNKSRLEMTNGRITTLISADASYLDWAVPRLGDAVTMAPQIVIGIALLIWILGYSALVGLAILMAAAPVQSWMFAKMLSYRSTQQSQVDTRVRLISEVINHIRAVKLYGYQTHFAQAVSGLRRKELEELRRTAVMTFVTYRLSGHTLEASKIFTALQFFNVLQNPISFLPQILAALTDALSAIRRIGAFLHAEELVSDLEVDVSAPYAIEVDADFGFDTTVDATAGAGTEHKVEGDDLPGDSTSNASSSTLVDGATSSTDHTFSLRDIVLLIPRGSLVCVVGRVGTGKSALLAGLVEEMRKTRGRVVFGGQVSYVPQQAWIHSGTIRQNIAFSSAGDSVDVARMDQIIDACSLRPDISALPHGDLTQVGERGSTLSGGQRQRLALARAAYSASDIVLLDDPLSAVDAQVAHHLLHNCILSGPLESRTRVMVTHQLEVLERADWVVVMDRVQDVGRIVQQRTYRDLQSRPGLLRDLLQEYGPAQSSLSPFSSSEPLGQINEEKYTTPCTRSSEEKHIEMPPQDQASLEERETGSVSWQVYKSYARDTGSYMWVGIIAVLLLCGQAANVANVLFLGYWSANSIEGFSQGEYMAVYAGLGMAMSLSIWGSVYTMIQAGLRSSFVMFDKAWSAILQAPMAWHARTPSGRIISRLSKDIEMLDDRLPQMWNSFLTMALSVLGTVGLYLVSVYYRATSREVKRLDSILRGQIYTCLSEQLAGLSVIRVFGRQASFERSIQSAVNKEGLIAIVGITSHGKIDPAKFGVVLTYALSATTTLTRLIPLLAYCEQEMNNVERIHHYTTLPSSPPSTLATDPPPTWPSRGEITFQNVSLRYRPDLPLALRDVSFTVHPGERVGIVGRTGAGKSSIAQALSRGIELEEGKIVVDGVDIAQMGLDTLRRGLTIVPQEPFLFTGTVRDNLDPQGDHTDAELNAALVLIRASPLTSETLGAKFKLEGEVRPEGGNFSAGEGQLSIVRRPKILVLDEATGSLDPETDALIQRIIQTELAGVTIISIAHRLQTIAYYNHVLVLDSGKVVEVGNDRTPDS
ncbi:hypothetical protein EHS25_007738 [Saitozyma podzolica]|uniref:Uncharacterized protein n=1 Tax=Saitozyma podzolica TaxID=1890683 RepID=A0A427YQL6_9TREE|nr:hypothetical protein EHS25_007738 [Saitozyma podzolica]